MRRVLERGRRSTDLDLDSAIAIYTDMLASKGNGEGSIAHPEQLEQSKLDFTVESLRVIDQYLDKLRVQNDGVGGVSFINSVIAVACYLGEVIRRSAPGGECQWIRASVSVPNNSTTGVNLFDFADIALAAIGFDRPLQLTGVVVRFVRGNGRESSTYEYAVLAVQKMLGATSGNGRARQPHCLLGSDGK